MYHHMKTSSVHSEALIIQIQCTFDRNIGATCTIRVNNVHVRPPIHKIKLPADIIH